MGIKGRRKGTKTTVDKPVLKKSQNYHGTIQKDSRRNDSDHYRLCRAGARWLRRHTENCAVTNCPFVIVEPATIAQEQPDIFGWDYWSTTVIEVKTSRQDFHADARKPFREDPSLGIGMKRMYLCPEGMIKENEIPEKWGLLYEKDKKICLIKKPEIFKERNTHAEFIIFSSLFRRMGIKTQIFDFHDKSRGNNTNNEKTSDAVPLSDRISERED